MLVDYKDESCHDKPLWLIYGHDSFPSILCCKLNLKLHGYTVIWGYSIYRRSPGFRTLGQAVDTWINKGKSTHGYSLYEFYDNHDEAIERIRALTTPKI